MDSVLITIFSNPLWEMDIGMTSIQSYVQKWLFGLNLFCFLFTEQKMVQEFEQEEWNAAWWFFFFWCKYEILESYLIFRYKIRDSYSGTSI